MAVDVPVKNLDHFDKDALKAVLPQFVPRMAHKWDSIGIQLAQAERVSQLRNSPEPNEKKIQDILDAWIKSTGRGLINTRPLLNVLRSSDVGLHDVAEDLDKATQEERTRRFWVAHPRWREPLQRRQEERRIEQVLDMFRQRFIADVDANAIVYDLEDLDIISDRDLKKVTRTPSRVEQNQLLHRCLKRKATKDTLLQVCDIMIGCRSSPRMNQVGKEIRSALETGLEEQITRLREKLQTRSLHEVFGAEYAEAIQSQANVTLQITKCTTIGLPRNGKTCLKHLLTGQEWDLEAGTASTDVMEAPEWVECYSLGGDAENSVWELFTREHRKEAVLCSLARKEYQLGSTNKDSTGPDQQSSTPLGDTSATDGVAAAQSPGELGTSDAALERAYRKMKLSEKLSLATQEQSKGVSLDTRRFIHFIDTGGQAIYHDVHPVLITSPSVYLVVVSLEVCLKEKNEASFLNTDLTQNALRSIHTFSTKMPSSADHITLHRQHPSVFIVGTHLDCIPPEDREATLSELHTAIEEKMLNKPYHRFVQYDPNDRCFWAVDNTKAGLPADKVDPAYLKYVNNLRSRIQERSMDMQVKVPLTWLLFEDLTHLCERSHFTHDELYRFAHNMGFVRNEADFKMLLHLFHILGLYYYKIPTGSQQAQRIVYTKPNAFYKITSDLLNLVQQQLMHQDRGEEESKHVRGIIDIQKAYEKLGAEMGSTYAETLPAEDWFISLLADLRLIAQVQGSSFIAPAALPPLEPSFEIGTVDSLLVTFTPRAAYKVCYIPSGLYCALIADLIATCKWEPTSLQRKHVVFQHSFGDVHISEEISYIEICISVDPVRHNLKDSTSLSRHCNRIREEIRDRLAFVWRRIYEDLQFSDFSEDPSPHCAQTMRWGFHCSSHLGEGGKTHIAEYIHSESTGYYAYCLKPRSSLMQLVPKRQAVWFQETDGKLRNILYLCN